MLIGVHVSNTKPTSMNNQNYDHIGQTYPDRSTYHYFEFYEKILYLLNLDFVLIFIGGPLFHPHSCISCRISEETRYVLIFMNMKKSIISILKAPKCSCFVIHT